MIAEAWDRFLSEALSMVMGGGLLVLLLVTAAVFGYWLRGFRRELEVDQAVKRDRVARGWEDAAARTVRIAVPGQRDGAE